MTMAPLTPLLAFLLCAACGSQGARGNAADGGNGASDAGTVQDARDGGGLPDGAASSDGGVQISVTPQSAHALAGGYAQFQAPVTGPTNAAVTWRVQEGSVGGSVGVTGQYTAPAAAGVYRRRESVRGVRLGHRRASLQLGPAV
jgi:hypothetical protein